MWSIVYLNIKLLTLIFSSKGVCEGWCVVILGFVSQIFTKSLEMMLVIELDVDVSH